MLLGTNEGDREKNLSEAKELIANEGGRIMKRSFVYETEAWGNEDQPLFYNCALLIETKKNARELLDTVLNIEKKMGRVRNAKWEPRIIDIDILFFNEEIINEEGLRIPHPFIAERRFVLVPLNEISANAIHPVHKKKISELLAQCSDPLEVKKVEV